MHDVHGIYLQWTKAPHKTAKSIFPFSGSSFSQREPLIRLIIVNPKHFEKYATYYGNKKKWLSSDMLNDIKFYLAKLQDELEENDQTIKDVIKLHKVYNWFVKPRNGIFWPTKKSWRQHYDLYKDTKDWPEGHPDHKND